MTSFEAAWVDVEELVRASRAVNAHIRAQHLEKIGKQLNVCRQNTPHGLFVRRLAMLGIPRASAYRYMRDAAGAA